MTARVSRLIVVVFAGVYAAIGLATLPAGPFTAPDSAAYLEMQPIVPVGYPLLLRLVGPMGAIMLQPTLFAAALAFLGLEILAASASLVLAVVVMAGIVVTPDLRAYHASILTESLFISGLLVFLALVTRFVRAPSWKVAAGAALVAIATVTVRRAAFAFLPVIALMLMMQWRRLPHRTMTVSAAVLPVVAVLGAERLAVERIHGDQATSLTGRHLFAKAALIDAPPAEGSSDGRRTRLNQALQVDYAPMRALIARAPRSLRASLTLYYETCLQGPCVSALRDSLGPSSEAEKNDLLADVARARILAAPAAFASLTAGNYVSFWTAYKIRHPATATQFNAFAADNRPLPFERETFKVTPEQPIDLRPSAIVRVLQPAIMAIGWLTAGMAAYGIAGALRRRMAPLAAVSSLAALTAHGVLWFSALAAAGVSRFMVSVFPAVIVSLCVGVWWVGLSLGRRVARSLGEQYH